MRLKTKLVLAISSMVFALVAIFSYLYVSHLVRQRTTEAYDSADFVAKEIRESAREASQIDLSSAFVNENDPKQVEEVLDEALQDRPRAEHPAAVGRRLFAHHLRCRHRRRERPRHCSHRPSAPSARMVPQREDFQKVRNGSFLRAAQSGIRRAAGLRRVPARSSAKVSPSETSASASPRSF